MQNETIIDVTEETIQSLLARSYELPVLFYFWSEQDPQTTRQNSIVDKLVASYRGQFILAKLNCDTHPMLAAEFGLQTLPTFYLFKEGQPVDGLKGFQSTKNLQKLLLTVLPDNIQLKLDEVRQYIKDDSYDNALLLLKSLYGEEKEKADNRNAEIAVLLADTLLHLKQVAEAEKILASIDAKDCNAETKRVLERLKELKESANSPELQQLAKQFKAKPGNPNIRICYARKLQEVGRLEEALAILFESLETDLNAGKGSVKDTFLEILTATGTSNPLGAQYRRQLYALMY